MHRTTIAAAALAFTLLGALAARGASAGDLASPAGAFELGRADRVPAPDAPPLPVLPLPLPWQLGAEEEAPPADALLVGGAGPCAAHPCSPCSCACPCDAQRWRWTLTLPVWIPSISGTFASGGVSAQGDRSPPDLGGIVENFLPDTASSLEFAFVGRVTAAKGPWSVTAEALYASVSETIDWVIRDTDTTGSLDAAIARVYGAWQTTRRLGCSPCGPVLRYGPLVGARGYMIDLHVDRANGAEVDGDKTWIDPIVGVKADLTFRNGASIGVIADVGSAFDGSHYSWSVSAELLWPLSRSGRWFILGGWTVLNVDYDVPLGRDGLEVHLHLSGPHLGISYRF